VASDDPAPSDTAYPPFVSLLRSSRRGAGAAPARSDLADIEAWLLSDALKADDLLLLYEELLWRLVAAGLPLDRASLHVGTLHPQIYGYAWNWRRRTETCDEVQVGPGALESSAYLRNPLSRVIGHGESLALWVDDPEAQSRFQLMRELAAEGYVAYRAFPIGGGAAYHNAATVATKRPGGFTAGEVEGMTRLHRLFGLHVERHIARTIAANVMDTYLGPLAGRQVLEGSIRRGAGAPIEAVVWMSDLRGFTDLTDRLTPDRVTAILNAYFERTVEAVLSEGGDVLKFIGDGLLAVFPIAAFSDSERGAATASLAAARKATAALEALNGERQEGVPASEARPPLRMGIALHRGEVFFGNVGGPARLDFTVIGRVVNETSRIEALTKELQRPILVSEAVARDIGETLEAMGERQLRGLARSVALFAPRP